MEHLSLSIYRIVNSSSVMNLHLTCVHHPLLGPIHNYEALLILISPCDQTKQRLNHAQHIARHD